MKKVLVMMVVMGTMSYGRDFEYNGKRDVERYIQRVDESKADRTGRSICGEGSREFDSNFKRYSRLHREVDPQNKRLLR